MLKYISAASALKLFSATSIGRRAYRALGNTVGARARIRRGLEPRYLQRAKYIIELCDKYGVPQKGEKTLEIGTGWVHWESLILRLFFEAEPTAFDVWDNRQLSAFRYYVEQLIYRIDSEFALSTERLERAHSLLSRVRQARSFEEAYKILDMIYVIDPTGTLRQMHDKQYSLVASWDVLEHINRPILPNLLEDFYRVLKPGGYSIHQIDMRDHLTYYDSSVCHKYYLTYPDSIWRRVFENRVQYFNRVQRPEWMTLFENAGLELVHSEFDYIDITTMKVDRSYAHLSQEDLSCSAIRVVHRKNG
jgi:Methyltransferase domain